MPNKERSILQAVTKKKSVRNRTLVTYSDKSFPQIPNFSRTKSAMNFTVPSMPNTEESIHRW